MNIINSHDKTVNVILHDIKDSFDLAKKHFSLQQKYLCMDDELASSILKCLQNSETLSSFGNQLIRLIPHNTIIELLVRIQDIQSKFSSLVIKQLKRYELHKDISLNKIDKQKCEELSTVLQVYLYASTALNFLCSDDT